MIIRSNHYEGAIDKDNAFDQYKFMVVKHFYNVMNRFCLEDPNDEGRYDSGNLYTEIVCVALSS